MTTDYIIRIFKCLNQKFRTWQSW